MRESAIENSRLRRMIEFKQTTNYPLVPADVVGKSIIEMRNFLTLNRGSKDSILYGMPVRTDAGLVGTIIGTSENYSIVELITNRNVKISARIIRTGVDGIALWDGSNNFTLNNIPESFDVTQGDYVVTSEYSNKYPSGIPFGEITHVEKDPSSLFKKITITPFANISTLEQVFIVKYQADPERIQLIQSMEENLQKRK